MITLDVMMPQARRLVGAREAEGGPGAAHIPVIMVTIMDDRTMGFSLGAAEFMTKPVDRDRLVGAAASLRRSAARTPWCWSSTTIPRSRDVVRRDAARRPA